MQTLVSCARRVQRFQLQNLGAAMRIQRQGGFQAFEAPSLHANSQEDSRSSRWQADGRGADGNARIKELSRLNRSEEALALLRKQFQIYKASQELPNHLNLMGIFHEGPLVQKREEEAKVVVEQELPGDVGETPVLGGLPHKLLNELLEWLSGKDLLALGATSFGTSRHLE